MLASEGERFYGALYPPISQPLKPLSNSSHHHHHHLKRGIQNHDRYTEIVSFGALHLPGDERLSPNSGSNENALDHE
jgi:hypothetical protein